jgi:hypothetical protein
MRTPALAVAIVLSFATSPTGAFASDPIDNIRDFYDRVQAASYQNPESGPGSTRIEGAAAAIASGPRVDDIRSFYDQVARSFETGAAPTEATGYASAPAKDIGSIREFYGNVEARSAAQTGAASPEPNRR